MGCGESKLAVATADGILRRKKSIANGSKSARKVADGSKSGGADLKKIDEDVKVESEEKIKSGADLKVASEKKNDCDEEKIDSAVKIESENKIEKPEEKKSDEVKIDGPVKIESDKIDGTVKIESENKIEKPEEKKSDEVKIDGPVKIESDKIDGTVKIESEKTIGEEKIDGAVNDESENKTEHQEEMKSDGVNGGAVEKQVVAGETKAEEEAVDNGGGNEVKQEIKLVAKPEVENQNGEAEEMKEVPAKKEITAPKVEETQISATPAAQDQNNVKDVKENAADLPVKVSTAEEQK